MRKLDSNNFIFNTNIDDINWKEELIKILKEIFPEKTDEIYSNISDLLYEFLNTKTKILFNDNEKSNKQDISKDMDEYNDDIAYIESEIKSVAHTIEVSNNISLNKNNILKLQHLYNAYEKFDNYIKKNRIDNDLENKLDFEQYQKLCNKQLDVLINYLKNIKQKENNKDIDVYGIMYKQQHREKINDLMKKLPLTDEKKNYFIEIIEQYIRSKRQALSILSTISNEILMDNDIVSKQDFTRNNQYQKLQICEKLEDMFFIGKSGYRDICISSIRDDGSLQAISLSKIQKERIDEKIKAMKLANDFLDTNEIDKEQVDKISVMTKDPMILDLTYNIQCIYNDNLKIK